MVVLLLSVLTLFTIHTGVLALRGSVKSVSVVELASITSFIMLLFAWSSFALALILYSL